MKAGVVYSRGKRPEEIEIGKIREILRISAQMLGKTGLVLMIMAGLGLGYVFWPMARAEMKYIFRWSDAEDAAGEKLMQQWDNQKEIKEKAELPTWDVPDERYSIYIPKIMAQSRVIANVNAGDPADYLEALKNGVAEAAGLSHPGLLGTTYLFAHSVGSRADYARYNAVFYLLHRLEKGDVVEVVFNRNLFKYTVTDRVVLNPGDTRFLVPQKNDELLVLSTCYPPGTSWKRLVIVAKRVY